jgi:non-homologous end joining protein Ku
LLQSTRSILRNRIILAQIRAAKSLIVYWLMPWQRACRDCRSCKPWQRADCINPALRRRASDAHDVLCERSARLQSGTKRLTSEEFNPENYKDEYRIRVLGMLDENSKGKDVLI